MSSPETIIDNLINKARIAQKQINHYTQEDIDKVCVAVGWEVYNDTNIKALATLAVEETGMGNVTDKITKHKNKVLGVLSDTKGALSVGLIERDEAKKISKYAKPVGVVGALTPVTNPTATPASNAITILKGRNAVIFAPHPKSKRASKLAVDYMRQGLRKVGAPEDLIQIIEEPSVELTNVLMRQVDVILATGGSAMVKAAYSSGKPAYGVGPGNSVQIIAEDADIEGAAEKIMMSKAFDHATSCSSENVIIIETSVADQMFSAMQKRGAYRLDKDEQARLEATIWVTNKHGYKVLNPAIIAKSAEVIATSAGIKVPTNTNVLLAQGLDDIENDLFSQEKLSPVLTYHVYSGFDHGYRILERLTDHVGTGHSCGIHTFNQSYVDKLSLQMRTSRILVNQPQAAGNGGAFFNGMPSTVSLGCGSWGGNITTENIYYKHFLNVTWVSEYVDPVRPTDQDIFGELLKSYGQE